MIMGKREQGLAFHCIADSGNGKGEDREAPFLSVLLRFLLLCYYHHSCLPVVSMY